MIYKHFKFGYPCLTLKEGPKVKSDHNRKFPAHDSVLVDFTSKMAESIISKL